MRVGHAGSIGPRGIIVIVIIVLFTIFVLQNTEVVEITFLFWRTGLSRVLLLLGSLVVGCLVGVLIGWEIFGRKKRTP